MRRPCHFVGLGAGGGQGMVPWTSKMPCISSSIGFICFLAWITKAGAFVHFISDTVLTGYKAGAALVIASTQLPKLRGLPAEGHNFFVRLARFVSQMPAANHASLLVGSCALIMRN